MLLAIDPGCDTGWALFDSARRLTACGLGDPRPVVAIYGNPDRVLIESPFLRPRGEKNPNAILKLARNAGEWGGRFGDVEYLTPNDWKGCLRKETSHARLWTKLDDKEKSVVDRAFKTHPGRDGMAASKRHNVLDAIGIGLFGVHR